MNSICWPQKKIDTLRLLSELMILNESLTIQKRKSKGDLWFSTEWNKKTILFCKCTYQFRNNNFKHFELNCFTMVCLYTHTWIWKIWRKKNVFFFICFMIFGWFRKELGQHNIQTKVMCAMSMNSLANSWKYFHFSNHRKQEKEEKSTQFWCSMCTSKCLFPSFHSNTISKDRETERKRSVWRKESA